MQDKIKQIFETIFKTQADAVFFAPGRVNLIGEHIDYNGGHVFPCALSLGTYAAAKKRTDTKLRFYSENFPQIGVIELDLADIKFQKEHDWTNYPKGVIDIFRKEGYQIPTGFDVAFIGNIPNGAGLSSSASIEVCTGVLLNDFFGLNIDLIHIAKMGQRTENEFIGLNSGIMDQFASAMGRKDHAILLNTNTMAYKHVPVILKDASIVIANTNKRRELAGSKYNERRAECETALNMLNKELNIKDLCVLTPEEFEQHKHLITDPIALKRAKHAVYENFRTLAAVGLLEEGDLSGFGKLMDESHNSLRDDYEVTVMELDTIVDLARAQKGVIGSRMTGAGFGGCAVYIVKNDCIDDLIKNVGPAYKEKTGLTADFYVAQIGQGACKLP
ncbi:galactokinase [Elusimicrobium simillimum]|uniref:galactokinase n=1 Tax=Elusimicrobium simillimum TaxID=3143438 RepID=UPI003C6FCE1C